MTIRSIIGTTGTFLVIATSTSVAAQAPALSPDPRPFFVSSIGSTYPFTVAVRGSYRVFGDSVVIDVTEGEVANQIPADYGKRGRVWSITLRAELGKGTIESWVSVGDTPAAKVGPELLPGRRIPLPAMRFVIRGTDTLRLRDNWLAFELGVQQNLGVDDIRPGLLTSYACTEDFVLGPTPESQARAQAQRKNYSTVC